MLPRFALREGRSRRREEGDWPCDVCGRWRPDAQISVESTWLTYNGVELQQNVKFCNDRPACVAAAPRIRFFKEDT